MRWIRAIPSLVVRQRRRVLLAWIVVVAAILPMARGVEGRLDTGARVPGSESTHVTELLATRFASPFARYAVLVVQGMPDDSLDRGRISLRTIVDSVAANRES